MRVTQEHWQVFLEVAERNPGLITNKFNGAQGNALWNTIATKLNGLGYGQKTVVEWRKAVTDWESQVKSKGAKIKMGAEQTGGVEASTIVLTPLEERLLALMGTKCLEGDSGIAELGLPGTRKDNNMIPVSRQPSPSLPQHEYGQEIPQLEEDDILVDHQYSTPTATLKRKAGTEINTASMSKNTPKRRRVNNINGLAHELQQMTGESVNILRNIDSSISRMADSLEQLVNNCFGIK